MEQYQGLIGLTIYPTPKTEVEKLVEQIEYEEYKKEMGIALVQDHSILPHRPKGRPTVITKEVLRDLRTAFQMGCNDDEAAAFAQISRATYYNYTKANPQFLDFVVQWKQTPILKAKASVYRSLINTDTAQWYLERKARHEFALRQELSGPDGKNIAVTLDRLETDYGDVANKASAELGSALTGQVVEDDSPIQGEQQAG